MCTFRTKRQLGRLLVRDRIGFGPVSRDCEDATSGCLVQVTGMITTFSFVASLIALLVSECPEGANVQARESYGLCP